MMPSGIPRASTGLADSGSRMLPSHVSGWEPLLSGYKSNSDNWLELGVFSFG